MNDFGIKIRLNGEGDSPGKSSRYFDDHHGDGDLIESSNSSKKDFNDD